eukprot:TRINITY_DN1805_c0_g2_i1.p1 TRINITY_DN1805_c0_g2~~TRINITY_DN1805_c0_g2_i1.p1  ORF type:complete len:398 (-),score=52.65 TRINITY_DN1805_c0_g2_i1:559-1752(-)
MHDFFSVMAAGIANGGVAKQQYEGGNGQNIPHGWSPGLTRSRSLSPQTGPVVDVDNRNLQKETLLPVDNAVYKDKTERMLDFGPIPKSPSVAKRSKMSHEALVSMICYCVSSCGMILLNKFVLSRWDAHIALMFYQNFISVIVVSLLGWSGAVVIDPMSWTIIRIWMPINFIFVGMLISSFFSLQFIGVAMVTILKNMTNVFTAMGEMYLFSTRHKWKVWGALMLMIVSALFGGITDLQFHPYGYAWQLLNCCFTASYSLALRRVMDVAKSATKTGNLSEFSMVLLNNSLSLPMGLILIFVFGEDKYIRSSPLIYSPSFIAIATLSGLVGLSISFTSMWFLHSTSPTTYSLVGSLNKIPLSIAGMILFRAPTTVANVASIGFGLFAGIVFAMAKLSR